MKTKNKIFDLLIDGRQIIIDSPDKQNYINRYNDIMLCREFGWTPYNIQNLSSDFYNDVLLLLNKECAKQQKTLKNK